jgi:hypothetical protein
MVAKSIEDATLHLCYSPSIRLPKWRHSAEVLLKDTVGSSGPVVQNCCLDTVDLTNALDSGGI